MADFLKDRHLSSLSKKSKTSSAYAACLQENLQKLGCPFTESADETWIVELIFKPGEPRIRILQWLLSKFHRSVYNFLDPIYSRTEQRLKAILQTSSALGLCRPCDIQLIEGNTSMSKQMSFMNKLIDMVLLVDECEAHHSPSQFMVKHSTSTGITTDDEYSRDCALIDSIASQQPVKQIFPSNISILSPDVKRSLQKSEPTADMESRCVPDIQQLTQRAMLLEEDLSRQNDLHQQLVAEHPYSESDEAARTNLIRKLKLILSELQQMMVNYAYCYENHIQPWCNRDAPQLSKLGDKIAMVLRLLNNFTTTLGALQVIKSSHTKLAELGTKLSHQTKNKGSVPSAQEIERLYDALTSLEQTLNSTKS